MTGAAVLLAADARPQSGGGHLARLRTLETAFGESETPVRLIGRDGEDFAEVLAAADAADARLIVLDDYGASFEDDLRLKRKGRRLAALCDGPTGPRALDLIVDAAARAGSSTYAETSPAARLLLGPQWAFVDPRYTARRSASLARRAGDLDGRARLVIAFGMVDRPGGAFRAIEAVQILERERLDISLTVDLVIGPHCPHTDALTRAAGALADAEVLVDPPDLPDRLAAADIAIGACGVSSWERAVLGLPAVSIVNNPSQDAVASTLLQAGAAAWCRLIDDTRPEDVAEAVRSLLENDEARRAMSAAAAGLIDGQGARRAAHALSALLEDER